jgi:uncharacterized protein Yka (UPF0111/DUF47 family)
MNLPSTFMMPFSRRDLLDVLLIQDSIANITKDLAIDDVKKNGFSKRICE